MPRILSLGSRAATAEMIAEVREHLARGGVAVVPTDTIYGLAANALDPDAVAGVFALKGRDFDKALPVVVRDRTQAQVLAAELPEPFQELTAEFWPGPLTLVLKAAAQVPPMLSAGTGTIAMRQPDLPWLAALLASTGFPLTATSANRSGQASCRTAQEVLAQFGEACPLVVDAGMSPCALASTIVDLSAGKPRLVRAGAIARERLARYL
ncbi:MAG: L-threonylcarbamoyladenylate synthase [Terriglobales bacterium]